MRMPTQSSIGPTSGWSRLTYGLSDERELYVAREEIALQKYLVQAYGAQDRPIPARIFSPNSPTATYGGRQRHAAGPESRPRRAS